MYVGVFRRLPMIIVGTKQKTAEAVFFDVMGRLFCPEDQGFEFSDLDG